MTRNESFVIEFSTSNGGIVESIFNATWILIVFILNVSTNIVVIGATRRKAIYCSHISLFVIKNLAISNLLIGLFAIGPNFAVICRNKVDLWSCRILDSAKPPLVIPSFLFSMSVNLEKLLSMNKPLMARKLSLWPRGYLYVIGSWTLAIIIFLSFQLKLTPLLSYDFVADTCRIELSPLDTHNKALRILYLFLFHACPPLANAIICLIMARRVSILTTTKSQQRGAVKALLWIAIIDILISLPLFVLASFLSSPLRTIPELSFLAHYRFRRFVIFVLYTKSCTTGIIFYATLKSFRLYVNRILWKKLCDSIRWRLICIRVKLNRITR
eukprot:sb/3466707/